MPSRDLPEIERFQMVEVHDGKGNSYGPEMVPRGEGPYMSFSDHQQLVAAKDERIAELEAERGLAQAERGSAQRGQSAWRETAQKAEADLASLSEALEDIEATEIWDEDAGDETAEQVKERIRAHARAALDKATPPTQENTFQEDLAEVEGEAAGDEALDSVQVARRDSDRILWARRLPDGEWHRLNDLLPNPAEAEAPDQGQGLTAEDLTLAERMIRIWARNPYVGRDHRGSRHYDPQATEELDRIDALLDKLRQLSQRALASPAEGQAGAEWLDRLLTAVAKQQEYTRMCVEGPLNTQLRDLYLAANEIRDARASTPAPPVEAEARGEDWRPVVLFRNTTAADVENYEVYPVDNAPAVPETRRYIPDPQGHTTEKGDPLDAMQPPRDEEAFCGGCLLQQSDLESGDSLDLQTSGEEDKALLCGRCRADETGCPGREDE